MASHRRRVCRAERLMTSNQPLDHDMVFLSQFPAMHRVASHRMLPAVLSHQTHSTNRNLQSIAEKFFWRREAENNNTKKVQRFCREKRDCIITRQKPLGWIERESEKGPRKSFLLSRTFCPFTDDVRSKLNSIHNVIHPLQTPVNE